MSSSDPIPNADAAFAEIEARIARTERPGLWWFRARSTAIRRLVVWGVGIASVAFCVVAFLRPDWAHYPGSRMAFALGGLAILWAACTFAGTRPIHVPPLSRTSIVTLVVIAISLVFALASLPAAHTAVPSAFPPEGKTLIQHAGPCILFGLAFGVPVYLAVYVVNRGAYAANVLGLAAAGMLGNLALQLHCPITQPNHLLWGHASVAVLFLGTALIVRACWAGRARPRAPVSLAS